jgi:predicted kinase
MARLLLINGLPATGKSTLAVRWAAARPGAVVLELDDLVAAHAHEDPDHDPWLDAHARLLDQVRAQLEQDRDVVVPQLFGNLDRLTALETACEQAGAGFVHVTLASPSPAEAAERFRARAAIAETPQHAAAPLGPADRGSAREFEVFAARLERVLAARPDVRVVEVIDGDVEATLARLDAALAATA